MQQGARLSVHVGCGRVRDSLYKRRAAVGIWGGGDPKGAGPPEHFHWQRLLRRRRRQPALGPGDPGGQAPRRRGFPAGPGAPRPHGVPPHVVRLHDAVAHPHDLIGVGAVPVLINCK